HILHEGSLQDLDLIRRLTTVHPSGLEILSIEPRFLKDPHLTAVPSWLNLLKDQYDFTLVLAPLEKDPLSQVVMQEADKAILSLWDQASDLAEPTRAAMKENIGPAATPV